MAQSRHRLVRCTCLLLGVKRTCRFALRMSAFDPKRTWNLGAVSRADLLDAAQNEVTKKVGAAVPVWRQPLRPPARG